MNRILGCVLVAAFIPRGVVRADVFHMPAGLKSLETVVVGDPGNAPDDTGFGAVAYPYKIGKYEVTAAQYAAFLNAKAQSDPYRLRSNNTEESGGCGIILSGEKGSYRYTVAPELANLPVNHVSYWDACRFANWLHNGQGNGDTETGAYTLNGYTGSDGRQIRRNPGARWFVPSEDEWYKAAYFDPNKPGGAGYWDYPTRSDAKPNRDFTGSNAANFFDGDFLDPVRYLTHVGAFARSQSAYGTLDQGGNVFERNEAVILPLFRGVRGSGFGTDDGGKNQRCPLNFGAEIENEYFGFRIAGAVEGVPAVPPAPAASAQGDATGPVPFARRPWRDPENGKLFFPLGWYIYGTNAADLDEMAREGCNMALFVGAPTDLERDEKQLKTNLAAMMELLDQAHQRGIKLLIQCSWYEAFRDQDVAYMERARTFVETVSRHPGLLGYQLFDEPEYKGGGSMKETDRRSTAVFVDCLTQESEAIRRWDGNKDHLVQVVFNMVPFSGWAEFLPAINAFQIDRYPCDSSQAYFGHVGDWGPLIMAWSIAHGVTATADTGHRNPCPVLQGMGLSFYQDGHWWRTPLYEETRYMAYSSLTVGGWGFMHWLREYSGPEIIRNVARLHAEVRQLMPALEQSYENPPFTVSHNHESITRNFLTDCIADISTLELEDEKNYYLIVADNSGVFEDVSLRLRLHRIKDTQTRQASVMNEDWSREIAYDETTGEWVIATHKMCFGDVNIWVIPKAVK